MDAGFMPERAPLVMLTLLGTCFLLGAAGLAAVYGLLKGRREMVKKSILAGVVVGGGYVALLLVTALLSSEKVLAMGAQKYFCEVDCHEAYSVVSVRTAKTVGKGEDQRTAVGTFHIVTVRVWFDEDTISSRRAKDLPLHPNARRAVLIDEHGREYESSPAAQRALARAEGKATIEFTQPLKPGESYVKDLVFDLPSDAGSARLYVTLAGGLPGALLIGHERSPLHKRILFDLTPPAKVQIQGRI